MGDLQELIGRGRRGCKVLDRGLDSVQNAHHHLQEALPNGLVDTNVGHVFILTQPPLQPLVQLDQQNVPVRFDLHQLPESVLPEPSDAFALVDVVHDLLDEGVVLGADGGVTLDQQLVEVLLPEDLLLTLFRGRVTDQGAALGQTATA